MQKKIMCVRCKLTEVTTRVQMCGPCLQERKAMANHQQATFGKPAPRSEHLRGIGRNINFKVPEYRVIMTHSAYGFRVVAVADTARGGSVLFDYWKDCTGGAVPLQLSKMQPNGAPADIIRVYYPEVHGAILGYLNEGNGNGN